MSKFGQFFNKVGFELKKHSPEILVVTGVIGGVAGAVLACKATTKASEVLKKTKEDVAQVNECLEHPENLPEPYTAEDGKKDLRIIYTKTGLQLVKLYAPSVVIGGLSIAAILGGAKIFKQRNVALAAAYTTIDSSFKDYRKRVIDRFGEDLDKELKYNIKTKEVEETIVDEKGKEKKVKKTIKVVEGGPSEYAKFFDVGQTGWQKDPEHNLWYLRQKQNWANELLRQQGFLFLNDVYEMLGIPKTAAGQIVGWLYDEGDGDHHVDFGIYNTNSPSNRDFINGYNPTILLDFNVDGPIYNKIEHLKKGA